MSSQRVPRLILEQWIAVEDMWAPLPGKTALCINMTVSPPNHQCTHIAGEPGEEVDLEEMREYLPHHDVVVVNRVHEDSGTLTNVDDIVAATNIPVVLYSHVPVSSTTDAVVVDHDGRAVWSSSSSSIKPVGQAAPTPESLRLQEFTAQLFSSTKLEAVVPSHLRADGFCAFYADQADLRALQLTTASTTLHLGIHVGRPYFCIQFSSEDNVADIIACFREAPVKSD